ncbi:MAG TPA: TonB-dependent receptor, partial [Melioribacteraceae bacterium]|nr:TonB-dependent receptor [Melioribacteraceae bacterium]
MLLLCSNELVAQNTGILRGFLTDINNGEVLAYGNVFVKEVKTGGSTDGNGYYYISGIPAGKTYTVVYSYVGYKSKEIKVTIIAGKMVQHNVALEPSSYQLQTIEKVADAINKEKNSTNLGLQRISIKELEKLPKGVETDVFRSLQYVPGVKSTGDVSARYYVRGGSSNQNLVLLNGATVYNPFHALGLFSVIDPEMINNVEFFKGGFSSEYGGRVSSVLKVLTKDGNRINYSAKASGSLMTGKVLLEGPFAGGSFLLTGRKSLNNEILKKFLDDQSVPMDFHDLSFKVNTNNPFIENGKFIFYGFLSADKLKNDDPLKEDFSWNNDIFGFDWQQVYDSPLISKISISQSKFTGKLIPNLSNTKARENSIVDNTLSFDMNYIYDSKDELGFGAVLKTINAKLNLENQNGALTSINDFGGNFSVYLKYKYLRFENLGIDLGVRANTVSFTPAGEFFLEPRVSFTYRINPQIALKGAYGVYQQEITTLSDEKEVISLFEPYIITPEYLEPSRAQHYIGGLEIDLTSKINIQYELYYKKVLNLPLINEKKIYNSDPDFVSGESEAYGNELMIKYNDMPFSLTLSYSLSYAYNMLDGKRFYPKYDSRHNLNIMADYNFGNDWMASIIWSYNTGLPFTKLIGYYDKLYLNDFYSNWILYGQIIPYAILGDKNIGRLPDYHRLDVSLSKKLNLGFANMYIDISVINV